MANQETRAEARTSPGTAPAVGSAEGSKAAAHRRTVIVPRRPGLLQEYQPRSRRPRDELDELIDELFGPPTDERPSRFDAGLVIVGLGLAAWAIVLGGPSVALWIGSAAIVLGLALPARAVLRRFDSSSSGLRRRFGDRGLPLDASQPATMALIGAYARLVQTSRMHGAGDPHQVVAAGHAAVVEVARQLDGQPPDTPEEIRFVSMRTEALEAHIRHMLRSHEHWLAQTAIQAPPPAAWPHSTPPQIPMERRWMPPRAQVRSPNLRNPTIGPGRRS